MAAEEERAVLQRANLVAGAQAGKGKVSPAFLAPSLYNPANPAAETKARRAGSLHNLAKPSPRLARILHQHDRPAPLEPPRVVIAPVRLAVHNQPLPRVGKLLPLLKTRVLQEVLYLWSSHALLPTCVTYPSTSLADFSTSISSRSFQEKSCIRGRWKGPFHILPLTCEDRLPSRCR